MARGKIIICQEDLDKQEKALQTAQSMIYNMVAIHFSSLGKKVLVKKFITADEMVIYILESIIKTIKEANSNG